MSVSLSVSNITQKVVDGFGCHGDMGPGTSDKILEGDPYTLSLVKTLAVCLGGGLRSPSAFLVFCVSFSVNTWMSCLVDGLFPSYTSTVDNSNGPSSSSHTHRQRVLTVLAHVKKLI